MRQFCLLISAYFALALSSCVQQQQNEESPPGYPKVGHIKGVKTASYKVRGKRYHPLSVEKALQYDEVGIASYYGKSRRGERTASGEYMNSKKSLSAAHKTLPLPCSARVTCLASGKSCVVRVNDRGPFVANRLIDVSPRAAEILQLKGRGLGKVRVEVLSVGDDEYRVEKN